MGWSSGSELFGDIIGILKKGVPEAKVREKIYKKLIEAFENFDCDTLYELEGEDPAFDKVFKKLHPED